ncbi:hypothetical protein PaeCFBP13512_08665 [Paenibacillus sp. CFBP13512]|nr:hypothetical protein PaeCFBP13512_08665 [Paenibacillus sp. CFBP13512]
MLCWLTSIHGTINNYQHTGRRNNFEIVASFVFSS